MLGWTGPVLIGAVSVTVTTPHTEFAPFEHAHPAAYPFAVPPADRPELPHDPLEGSLDSPVDVVPVGSAVATMRRRLPEPGGLLLLAAGGRAVAQPPDVASWNPSNLRRFSLLDPSDLPGLITPVPPAIIVSAPGPAESTGATARERRLNAGWPRPAPRADALAPAARVRIGAAVAAVEAARASAYRARATQRQPAAAWRPGRR
jgi:hypothetical protein